MASGRHKITLLRPVVIVPGLLIAVTAVCWWVAVSGWQFIMDDLSFHLRAAALPDGIADFPRMMGRRFLSLNGRFGDIHNPLWLYFAPRWMLDAVTALMMALLPMVMIKAAGARTLLSRTLLVAAVCMGLTWWDGFMLFVVQINYMWGSVLTVFVTSVILSRSRAPRPLVRTALILAFPAAGWHEMAGSTLSVGLAVWLLADRQRWHRLDLLRRATLLLFFAGSLLPYLSPMLWNRLSLSGATPDDTYFNILWKSNFPVLLLVAAILVFPKRAYRLYLRTGWGVWAIAAVLSMIISPLGGVIGRSGWYSQVYGLIALWPLLRVNSRGNRRAAHVAAIAAAAVVIINNVEFARWQTRLNSVTKNIIENYKTRPDKPVYIDIPRPEEMPFWICGRAMQLLNNDYFYSVRDISGLLFDHRYRLIILPTEVERHNFSTLRGIVRIGDSFVTDSLPVRELDAAGQFETVDGREWTATPFTQNGRRLLLIAPRRPIPGLRPFFRPRPEPSAVFDR